MAVDPSDVVKAKKAPATDGHVPWTLDQIAAFRARWSVEKVQRRALELLHWTGAGTVDAVAPGRGRFRRGGVPAHVQTKTGQHAYVRWSCTLPPCPSGADQAHLMAAPAHAPAKMTFLATEGGRGRTAKDLSNLISAAARAVVDANRKPLIDAPSAHGLRKSRTIALVDGGATEAQGMSWAGHLTGGEFSHYAKARNRRAVVIATNQGRNTVTSAQTRT